MKITRLFVLLLLAGSAMSAHAFKFYDPEEGPDPNRVAAEPLTESCRKGVLGKKIMVVIAEKHSAGYLAEQTRYRGLFNSLNQRLKEVGLKTYTQEQIRQQIAQAEINAYFNNDLDSALAASKKLAAQFVLRGTIQVHHGYNQTVGVNEVSLRMNFTLARASGGVLSRLTAESESYAGSDTVAMAQTLLDEQADAIVARLYNDYCARAR